ncbi:MAG: hypothetical protein ACRDZ3_06130 [Acidimicrobiia bacterium]
MTVPRQNLMLVVGGVVGVVAFVTGACANGDDSGGPTRSQSGAERAIGDQPAPGVSTFEQGLFDEIPRYQPSEPLGPRSEETDVVAQSFRARDVKPVELLAFYQARLEPRWERLEEPRRIGVGNTWQGAWGLDRWRLTISATEAPALEEATGPAAAQATFHTQYNLSLAPR